MTAARQFGQRVEVAAPDRLAGWRGEQQRRGVFLHVLREVMEHRRQHGGRNRDSPPASARLRWSEHQADPAQLEVLLVDSNRLRVDADVLTLQGGDLAPSEASEGAEEHQGAVPVGDSLD
jgi:hypothetical protein